MPIMSTEEFLSQFPKHRNYTDIVGTEITIASRMPGAEYRRKGISLFDAEARSKIRKLENLPTKRPEIIYVRVDKNGFKIIKYSDGTVTNLSPGCYLDEVSQFIHDAIQNIDGRFMIHHTVAGYTAYERIQNPPDNKWDNVTVNCNYVVDSGVLVRPDRTRIPVEVVYGITNNGRVNMTIKNYDPKTETVEVEKMITREAAEALAAQAAAALAVVNEREEKWGTDTFKNGQILYADVKWMKREECGSDSQYRNQRTYNYVFIKADGYWYSSGPRAGGLRFEWNDLVDWLNKRHVVRFGAADKLDPVIKKNKRV